MPTPSSTNGAALALRRSKVRSLLSGIFVQAIGATSHAAAARRIGVTEKTVRRWIKLHTPLDFELEEVMRRPG